MVIAYHILLVGAFVTSTTVLEDGKLMPQYVFEESFVDSTHVAAVCREVRTDDVIEAFISCMLQKKMPRTCKYTRDDDHKVFFSQVDFEWLLAGSTPLNFLPNDAAEEFSNFMQKPRKKF